MAEEIWHHGVKGMKWGVRHTPEQLGHKSGSKKIKAEEQHEDYKKAHDSKSVKSMSDKELRSRLNRLNMEKQYSQLNPTRVSRGREAIKTALKVSGSVAAASASIVTIKNNWNTISGWFGKG